LGAWSNFHARFAGLWSPVTTESVARAPSTALRAAALASMSAIGFMGPSVALVTINLNHEVVMAIS
jgi:hypothetical protein